MVSMFARMFHNTDGFALAANAAKIADANVRTIALEQGKMPLETINQNKMRTAVIRLMNQWIDHAQPEFEDYTRLAAAVHNAVGFRMSLCETLERHLLSGDPQYAWVSASESASYERCYEFSIAFLRSIVDDATLFLSHQECMAVLYADVMTIRDTLSRWYYADTLLPTNERRVSYVENAHALISTIFSACADQGGNPVFPGYAVIEAVRGFEGATPADGRGYLLVRRYEDHIREHGRDLPSSMTYQQRYNALTPNEYNGGNS